MMRKGKLCPWALALTVCLLGSSVHADTISFSATIPSAPTDWDDVATLSQFDPSLGTLNHIEFELEGDFSGTMQFENTSSLRSLFSLLLEWDLELLRPDQTLIVATGDSRLEEGLLDPFDGEIDFDGPSGVTFDVAADAIDSVILTDQADFDLFTGTGTVDLPVGAVGVFTVDASVEPYESAYEAFAGAEVTVTYDFVVPEPGTFALLGLGGLVGLLRRR